MTHWREYMTDEERIAVPALEWQVAYLKERAKARMAHIVRIRNRCILRRQQDERVKGIRAPRVGREK